MWSGMELIRMNFIVHVDICPTIRTASILFFAPSAVRHQAQSRNPNCKHCVAAKSSGQHRRKNKDSEGRVVVELHSDFFFIRKEKFFVVADLSSHMFGALWMSPDAEVNHRNLSYWLREFGCLDENPPGALHV